MTSYVVFIKRFPKGDAFTHLLECSTWKPSGTLETFTKNARNEQSGGFECLIVVSPQSTKKLTDCELCFCSVLTHMFTSFSSQISVHVSSQVMYISHDRHWGVATAPQVSEYVHEFIVAIIFLTCQMLSTDRRKHTSKIDSQKKHSNSRDYEYAVKKNVSST